MLLTYLMFVNIISVFVYTVPIRKNAPQAVKYTILSGSTRVKILVEEFMGEKDSISHPREDYSGQGRMPLIIFSKDSFTESLQFACGLQMIPVPWQQVSHALYSQ